MEASEEYFVLDSSSSSKSDHETSRGSSKRKRDDGEEELGDRLSEENLTGQMKHKKIASVRVKRIVDDESDEEIQNEDEDEHMLKAEEDSKKLRQKNTESVTVHPASNTSNTTERRSGGPSSRSRSRSPNRGRTARTIGSSSRSQSPLHQSSPLRRPSSRPPALPPVGAPAPALIVSPPDSPPPWFRNFQCAHFRDHSRCPRGDLCYYVTGPYQLDKDLWESLDMPGRDPPQNPQLGN